MKVAINTTYGGFGLSIAALHKCIQDEKYHSLIEKYDKDNHEGFVEDWEDFINKEFINPEYRNIRTECPNGFKTDYWGHYLYNEKEAIVYCFIVRYKLDRSNPCLIQLIEEMGAEVNGEHASLKVIEIPDDVEWSIAEYDGQETIHEKHRSWS